MKTTSNGSMWFGLLSLLLGLILIGVAIGRLSLTALLFYLGILAAGIGLTVLAAWVNKTDD